MQCPYWWESCLPAFRNAPNKFKFHLLREQSPPHTLLAPGPWPAPPWRPDSPADSLLHSSSWAPFCWGGPTPSPDDSSLGAGRAHSRCWDKGLFQVPRIWKFPPLPPTTRGFYYPSEFRALTQEESPQSPVWPFTASCSASLNTPGSPAAHRKPLVSKDPRNGCDTYS